MIAAVSAETTTLIAALLGATVGGLATFMANSAYSLFREKRKSRRIALALHGELCALRRHIVWRNYEGRLRRVLQDITDGVGPSTIHIPVTRNYLPVTRSALAHTGSLPGALPSLVSDFWTSSSALLEDFESLRTVTEDDCERVVIHVLELLEHTLLVADRIIAEVESQYPAEPAWP